MHKLFLKGQVKLYIVLSELVGNRQRTAKIWSQMSWPVANELNNGENHQINVFKWKDVQISNFLPAEYELQLGFDSPHSNAITSQDSRPRRHYSLIMLLTSCCSHFDWNHKPTDCRFPKIWCGCVLGLSCYRRVQKALFSEWIC